MEWNNGGGGDDDEEKVEAEEEEKEEEEDGNLHLMLLRWLICWAGWVWQGIKETNACNIVVENLER